MHNIKMSVTVYTSSYICKCSQDELKKFVISVEPQTGIPLCLEYFEN